LKLLLKRGRVLDPGERIDGSFDLLLAEGKIVELKPEIKAEADLTIEARGLVIVPGFIDLHVHLREPGFEYKETIATGSRAAARGGFTTICCMPNTNPIADSPETIRLIKEKARKEALVNVLPIAAITRGQKGQELVAMEELVAEGAVAFSDDGQPLLNSELMKCALERAAELGVPVIDHCEEKSLAGNGVINQGAMSRKLKLPGIPAAAEEVMVARDIILARRFGVPVHLAHLSTGISVELLKWGKENGAQVSAEVTPHHLLLTEDCLENGQAVYKVNPPLRTWEDVKILRKAIQDGLIDLIATDHAPHSEEEKQLGLEKAPFGINGLETAVPALIDKLVKSGELRLERMIEALSLAPAKLLRLENKGRIRVGAEADLTVLDLNGQTVFSKENFQSKSYNTPFLGSTLNGAVAMTIVAGKVVYSSLTEDRLIGQKNETGPN